MKALFHRAASALLASVVVFSILPTSTKAAPIFGLIPSDPTISVDPETLLRPQNVWAFLLNYDPYASNPEALAARTLEIGSLSIMGGCASNFGRYTEGSLRGRNCIINWNYATVEAARDITATNVPEPASLLLLGAGLLGLAGLRAGRLTL